MRDAYSTFVAAADKDVAFNRAADVVAGNQSEATYVTARLLIFVAIAIAALLCVIAGLVLVRAIS